MPYIQTLVVEEGEHIYRESEVKEILDYVFERLSEEIDFTGDGFEIVKNIIDELKEGKL